MVGLGDLPGSNFFSQANDTSGDGSAIVGRGNGTKGSEAYIWTRSNGMIGLGDLPGGRSLSVALGASPDARVVDGVRESATGLEAYRWDISNGLLNLKELLIAQGVDLGGWTLNSATGISADGRTIVGKGTNPAGLAEAFMATLDDVSAQHRQDSR